MDARRDGACGAAARTSIVPAWRCERFGRRPRLGRQTLSRPSGRRAKPAFTVDVDGFEGPLDLLLELARRQKVDLAKISILELANQYLAFVEAARKVRLELAADYLVMAAWLAYLKSRLLLPDPPKAEAVEAADLAEELARRLRQLEEIRRAAEAMMNRAQLGRDVFARGAPEGLEDRPKIIYEASLYDLLSSYARQAQRHARAHVRMKPREVWSLSEARDADDAADRRDRATGRPSTTGFYVSASIRRCAAAPAPPPSRPRSKWCARG